MVLTTQEKHLVLTIVASLISSGLLYGEELKEYVLAAAQLGGERVPIRDYAFLENEILTRVDKKINKRHPDGTLKEKGHSRKARAVLQIDKDTGEVIGQPFSTVSAAEKATGVKKSQISGVCKGAYKTAGGYKWKYAENTV